MVSDQQSSNHFIIWFLSFSVILFFITSILPIFIVPNYHSSNIPNTIEYSITSSHDDYDLGVYLESDIGITCSDTLLWFEDSLFFSFFMNATLDTGFMDTIQLEVTQIQVFLDVDGELVLVQNIMGDNLTLLSSEPDSKDYGLIIESNLTEPIWDLYFQHTDDNFLLQTKLEFRADLRTTSEKTNNTWVISSYESFGIGDWPDKDLPMTLDAPWVRYNRVVDQFFWVIPLIALLLCSPLVVAGFFKGFRRTAPSWTKFDLTQPITATLVWSAITLAALYGAINAISSYSTFLDILANVSVGSYYSIIALAFAPPIIISIFIITYRRGGEELSITIRQQVVSSIYFVYFLIQSLVLGYCSLAQVIPSIRGVTLITTVLSLFTAIVWISLNRYHNETENKIASNTRWELAKILLGILVTGICVFIGSSLLF